jgi:rhamnose utilization protein RhaD (predicted bifunctional aldolase and dehydrogenase)
VEGKAAANRLFPDGVWVDACKPGYILALECKTVMDAYKAAKGKDVEILFLQNHGIFFAGETAEEVSALAERTIATIEAAVKRRPDDEAIPVDLELREKVANLYGGCCVPLCNGEILKYDPNTGNMTPDHIVYAKAKQLAVKPGQDLAAAFESFEAANGYKPKVVFVQGKGMFACGASEKEALTAALVMYDAIKVVCYSESFGGVQPMPEFLVDFIVNWEVESYRSKVSN